MRLPVAPYRLQFPTGDFRVRRRARAPDIRFGSNCDPLIKPGRAGAAGIA